MPIFKLCLLDRTKKVMVKANTLEEMKILALKKLGSTAIDGMVVLEDDGTEIDDTDILMELSTSSSMITYMILINNEVWSAPQPQAGILQTPTDAGHLMPTSAITPSGVDRAHLTAASPVTPSAFDQAQVPITTPPLRHQLPSIPWDQFPQEFISDCNQNKIPSPGDRREVIKLVGKYLVWDLKQTSRSLVESVAKAIVAKYPQTGDRIGSQLLGKGYESLLSQLYNKVLFENRIRKNRLQASGQASTSSDQSSSATATDMDDADDPIENLCPNTKTKKRPLRDSYGCVAWHPDAYPTGETAATQEEKRLWLLTQVEKITDTNSTQTSSSKEVLNKCCEAMTNTYVSQRVQINKKESVGSIINSWPFLGHNQCFLQHFSTLVGIDTHKAWMLALEKKSEAIVSFIGGRKCKRQRDILEILIPMKAACKTSSSKLPIHEAVVPLVLAYFGENQMYQTFESTETDAQVVEKVNVTTPILAILGSSLHAAGAKSLLIVDHEVLLRPTTVIDGFLLLLAAYYVFNIVYAQECSLTLEFIQRVFVGINPTTGDKRGGKRKKGTCAAKVTTLVTDLAAFTNVFCLDE